MRKINFENALLMGILNVTPDSFSDAGEYMDLQAATSRVVQMISQGADIIDIGGESSGPGSEDLSLNEEAARTLPIIEAIKSQNPNIFISVDTYKSEIARQAIDLGVELVNDVTACRVDKDMAKLIAEKGVYLVIMYSKDSNARTTIQNKEYDDVIASIKEFFQERIAYLKSEGVKDRQIILDPGMGHFVSSLPQYSWEIIDRLLELKDLGYPILLGPSRKSFLGGDLEDRLRPSIDAAIRAIENGADIVRMHDVKECRKVMDSLANGAKPC